MMKTKADMPVNEVFTKAARHYDIMNDFMSGGLHRLWKRALVDMIPRPIEADHAQKLWLADIASGTGDVAFSALARHKGLNVFLCDPNENMIAGAMNRLNKKPASIKTRAMIMRISGEALPFADMSMHGCTMAFGIRNIENRAEALREAFRVLIPGGRFICLEFGRPALPFLHEAYNFYSREIIPRLAHYITGDSAPYEYLIESIRLFPSQDEFAALMNEAGFAKTQCINLTGGIAVIYSGWRI